MYYNSNEGLKPLVVSDTILDEALDVIGGEFTCCRLGLPDEDPCDREQLMLPLLGLYADVYAGRCGKHADAYAFIEPRKHQLFPSTFEYTHRSPDGIETTTTQMLFGDLIAAVEHATDQEESGDAKPTRAPDFKPGTNAQRHSLHRSKHGHGSEHDSGTESLGRMRVANLFGLSTRGRSDSDSLRLPS